MTLVLLPNELLLLIADHLPLPSLSALHRTTHHLRTLTTPHLHRAALLPRPSSYGMLLPALHWAAWNNYSSLARLLLTSFPESHSVDAPTSEHGKTPLHCAAWQGHTEMVRLLLDAGAEVDARDWKYGKTALHQAVVRGWANIVALLLKRGADVAARDNTGQTALLWAVKCQGRPESLVDVFRMLLDADRRESGEGEAMMDMQECERGETALHWAVWRGQPKTVQLLVQYGVDVSVGSWEGETAMDWAARKGDKKVLDMLMGAGLVQEMVEGELEAERAGERVWRWVEELGLEVGEGAGLEGERSEEKDGEMEGGGKKWGRRIRSIGRAMGRISLLKQLERRNVKELGEA